MSLTAKILMGVFLGILAGLLINVLGFNADSHWVNVYVVDGAFFVMGTMFINALGMLVVPLVFFSLVSGVCGIGNLNALGRVGGKALLLYLMTTAVAIAVAITIAVNVGLGEGMSLTSDVDFSLAVAPPLTEVLISIIPANPIRAMADGDMLSVIFFSILVGISLMMMGEKASPLIKSAALANEVMMKMVMVVMVLAPYAVFALISRSIAELGLELLSELAGYVLVLVAALLFHVSVTLMVVLKVFSGLNPFVLLTKMREAQIFAFSTGSSNATIPITLRAVTQRLGVNNSVASFTVPFGATINMDGTAIMQGVATVFIANLYGVDLGLSGYLTVIMMSVLASIGTAGVPGVGLIMLSMVFSQVGLPIEGIGLILGVDRLIDMIRTAVNVTGDAVVSVIVAQSEDSLNVALYQDIHGGADLGAANRGLN